MKQVSGSIDPIGCQYFDVPIKCKLPVVNCRLRLVALSVDLTLAYLSSGVSSRSPKKKQNLGVPLRTWWGYECISQHLTISAEKCRNHKLQATLY